MVLLYNVQHALRNNVQVRVRIHTYGVMVKGSIFKRIWKPINRERGRGKQAPDQWRGSLKVYNYENFWQKGKAEQQVLSSDL